MIGAVLLERKGSAGMVHGPVVVVPPGGEPDSLQIAAHLLATVVAHAPAAGISSTGGLPGWRVCGVPGDSPGPLQTQRLTGVLTLPDYLRPGLKLVFIGLNPGLYSARAGKYFARPTNRFWSALSASQLVGMNVGAGDESLLFEKRIGFTDVVKRATGQVSEVTRDEIAVGVAALRRKLEEVSPAVACFVGLTGYRWVFGIPAKSPIRPGLQRETIGSVRIWVLPSTSPANARFSFDDIVEAFRQLKSSLEDLQIRF